MERSVRTIRLKTVIELNGSLARDELTVSRDTFMSSTLATAVQKNAPYARRMSGAIQRLFDVPGPLFFLHDPQHARLTCRNAPAGTHLDIDLEASRCLPVTCFGRNTLVSSLDEPGEIMDRQLSHFLGREAIVCLPVSGRGACRGVIVIAADRDGARHLKEQLALVSLLTRQAACALEMDRP